MQDNAIKLAYIKAADLTYSVFLTNPDPFGRGGYSELYEGKHEVHGKVALKRLRCARSNLKDMSRFDRELELWTKVKHPNILPFLGICWVDQTPYMVSPFVPRGDLFHCIRRGDDIRRPRVLAEIANALSHLHMRGIVHGDVKAANVLVSNEGSALLCDFGLSKLAGNANNSHRWMAPELFNGKRETKKSDVYAFGITIAEVLSGKLPFSSEIRHEHALIAQVLVYQRRPRKSPLESPDGQSYHYLWAVAERCWATDPKQRPAMQGVASQLETMAEETVMSKATDPTQTVLSKATDLTHSISLANPYPVERGGCGELYVGRCKQWGEVALKRLRFAQNDPEALGRFWREVNLWGQVVHPNILPILGTCIIGHDMYMVSPFIRRGDLSQYLKAGDNLDKIRVLLNIAQAISCVHRQGIVHGDIKAKNVLISDTGSPLLCDFGLAKPLDSRTTSGSRGKGSLRWTAPELFEDEPKTPKSDVYAFGMLIAEVLTGDVPFASEIKNEIAVLKQVMLFDKRPQQSPLESLNGQSYRNVWRIAERCWIREPEQRPNMQEVAIQLNFEASKQ